MPDIMVQNSHNKIDNQNGGKLQGEKNKKTIHLHEALTKFQWHLIKGCIDGQSVRSLIVLNNEYLGHGGFSLLLQNSSIWISHVVQGIVGGKETSELNFELMA